MPKVNVADIGQEPVELYYEVHGNGPQHILFVNGLSAVAHNWDKQVAYFAALPEYSVCIFDNRGAGLSSVPTTGEKWTTKLMAKEAMRLLDHLGWHHVNVVGVSMGGMISQELALLLGDRVLSLTLESTYSKFTGLPLPMLKANLFGTGVTPGDIRGGASFKANLMFPKKWLDQPSEENPSVTNHEYITDYLAERTTAVGLQTPAGLKGQQRAATFHYCDSRLDGIRKQGYPVLVITGDEDKILIQPSSCAYLAKRLNARLEIYQGGGHALLLQDPKWHNDLLLETVRKGWERHLSAVQP
ncbi:Alpha/Beta hydrolase protein [Entophlyctis helioformis]|nr:Alpha/Beta hydrolase protein [Entophlyctis helioformis]